MPPAATHAFFTARSFVVPSGRSTDGSCSLAFFKLQPRHPIEKAGGRSAGD